MTDAGIQEAHDPEAVGHHDQVADVFEQVWLQRRGLTWDYLSDLIARLLLREVPSMQGRRVLEAGSGSGRIIAYLGSRGARVGAIDVSATAVEHTRQAIAARGVHDAVVEQADMFVMPFDDGHFDLVWNAGVIEHYSQADQIKALAEMARVCRPGGWVITLNPSYRSWLYRLGKWVLEKTGRWEYGYTQPIKTLKQVGPAAGLIVAREYSAGFVILWTESFRRFFRGGTALAGWLGGLCMRLARLGGLGRALTAMDLGMARLAGGYLLVTVMQKPSDRPAPSPDGSDDKQAH